MLDPRHPLRYRLSRSIRQMGRSIGNALHANSFSIQRRTEPLPVVIKELRTPVCRKLMNVPDSLFENKKTNLALALNALNGILIKPGERFSFWWLVGSPSKERGFKEGLVIQQGRADKGWGGGLCQLSNMIHFLALHSDLSVVERHRHSFDLFPDDHRTIPFGTGATVSFNYKDLRLQNPTKRIFQFLFELDEKYLLGKLLCSEMPEHEYVVVERDQRFIQENELYWRENKIMRRVQNAKGESLGLELLFQNRCECRYVPAEE